MGLNSLPQLEGGFLVIGDGADFYATSTSGDWPATTALIIESAAGVETSFAPTLATTTATWALTVAQVTALIGTKTAGQGLRYRITTGSGDTRRGRYAGTLTILTKWIGQRAAQSLGTVIVGPPGPTAVSADAGNAASLGTDGLIYVAPGAGTVSSVNGQTGAVVLTIPDSPDDIGAATAAQGALADTATQPGDDAADLGSGAAADGYVLTADGLGGAAWEAVPAGGSPALDDLSDVATAGAATGEALAYTGSGWAPTAAAVILEGDARLTDARTPTSHNHAASEITSGTLDAARLPAASETAVGAVELATTAEAVTGTDTSRAVTPAGVKAVGDTKIAAAIMDAKGDLLTATAADTPARLAVGTDGYGLVAASGEATGLKWAAPDPQYAVNVVAATGATETLPATYAGHKVTMDQNCTFTFTSPTLAGHTFVLLLSGAFTPTWPASVDWADATPPTYSSPTLYTFTTLDSGTTWLGASAGKAFG